MGQLAGGLVSQDRGFLEPAACQWNGKKNLQTLYGFPADDDEREETADDVILEFDFENSTAAEALQL